jgi:hypothetical protein
MEVVGLNNKNMKKVILFIVFIIIAYTGYKQYQVEKYISNQKTKYGILKEKERINYLPFVIHFFSGAINDARNKRIESKAFFIPYDIANVSTANTDKDFDSYMVYSYFTKEETKKYYEEFYSKRIKTKK